MVRSVVGDFNDTTVGPGSGEVLRFKFSKKAKVHKIYHYVSSQCDVKVYRGPELIFPEGGKIRVYNVFVVFDLPEPIDFDAGEEIIFRYENISHGNVRVIEGFAGVYKE